MSQSSDKRDKFVFIKPVLPGRMSMTREDAEKILNHPLVSMVPASITDEARAVQKGGEMWWSR